MSGRLPTRFFALVFGVVVVTTLSMSLVIAATDPVGEWADNSWFVLLVGACFSVPASFFLAWMIVLRPLRLSLSNVKDTADRLADGDVDARTKAMDSDEIGDLSRALDRAADRLAQRLEEHDVDEAQQRTLLDAMVEGVFVTDREGRIQLTNAALQRLLSTDVRGRSPIEAIRSAELNDAVSRALRGSKTSVQIDMGGPIEVRHLTAEVAPLPRGNGAVVVMHDVTHLKLADTVRRDFVANASHELRTPLTAIRGFAETLADGAINDPVVSKRFVGRIIDHAVRMQRLVDDMMELSRAEAPDVKMSLVAIDVNGAIAHVMRGFESHALEKKLQLHVETTEPLLFASADERAFEHVLVNLVDNAVKYTQEGSVTVRASADEQQHIVIEVTDTGGGIAPSHLPRIFERFYRVDPGRAREVGGTGLGLAIVKHLVQRMGGEVSVESKLGKGTTFRVRLLSATRDPSMSSPGTVEVVEEA